MMITRRRLLAVTALSPAAVARAHNDPGRVQPPLPAPPLALVRHDGQRTTLPRLLTGRSTALQLMFTGCSATCPIQGALFGAAQQHLPDAGSEQLVSVSIDPLNDDEKAMRGWLQRYGAGKQWTGATPKIMEVDQWFAFLRARNAGVDRHTAQVYFFNRRAELVLRSIDFPTPTEVVRLLAAITASR